MNKQQTIILILALQLAVMVAYPFILLKLVELKISKMMESNNFEVTITVSE